MSGLGCRCATLDREGRQRRDDLATLREEGKGIWPCDDYEARQWQSEALHERERESGERKQLLEALCSAVEQSREALHRFVLRGKRGGANR